MNIARLITLLMSPKKPRATMDGMALADKAGRNQDIEIGTTQSKGSA
jgi:hypothetical protein